MKHLFNRFIPFLLLGITIIVFAFGIMLLAYLLIIGAIVGFVLYLFSWIKQKCFSHKTKSTLEPRHSKSGRVIDSDHWKEL
jgi:uncharacterized membrane protein YGL010W